MGINNRRNESGTTVPTQPDIIGLIQIAIRMVQVSTQVGRRHIEQLMTLSGSAKIPELDPAALVVDEAVSRIRTGWEWGVQPNDLIHMVRRRGSAPAAIWTCRAILIEAERSEAVSRAPEAWNDQLAAVKQAVDAQPVDPLLPPAGRASVAEWTAALTALGVLHAMPPAEQLMPPPSAWGQTHWRGHGLGSRQARSGAVDSRELTRIRALLAKAESTEFPAEADALTAKAQDLMTRHAIDEAIVRAESGSDIDVSGVRVLIEHPYAQEKAALLHQVAAANRTRAVWHDFASYVTLVGVPTDLDQVEMLFTSVLVQATRAMTAAGQAVASGSTDRSTGFRKSFLIAYATRIGHRLTESTASATQSYGSALVPVVERQVQAVTGEFERLFPHVRSGSGRRTIDRRGWEAGTRAADAAVLPAGQVGS